jgi:sugar porter (SP) family MFS transporter
MRNRFIDMCSSVGALITSYFSGWFGRKPCLIGSTVIFIIGSAIQSVAGLGSSQTVGLRVLLFSRFLGGIGVGMIATIMPSYVSECTPRVIRGRCTGLIQLAVNVGIMLSCTYSITVHYTSSDYREQPVWVNYSASKNIPFGEMQWRIPFIVQIVPGALFIVLMLFQPESPRWLVEHERYDDAARTLAYVARTSVDDKAVIMTLEEIKADFLGKQNISVWKQVKMMGESRSTAIRCIIPSLMLTFQQWTGTNAINYFSPQIFAGLGITGTTSGLFATGIYGIVKVVSVALVLIFAVESIGRKNCLIIGSLGQALAMFWIGGYSAIHPQPTIVPASYVSIIAVYAYAVFFSIGWGAIPWAVASEVAPNHTRSVALSIALAVTGATSLVVTKATPIMLVEIKYGTFLLFGFCCLAAGIWVYVFLPETKGIALEDIKYLFENDMVVRALQDAPGGHVFLGKKHATPVAELIKVAFTERNQLPIVAGRDDKQLEEHLEDGVHELPKHSHTEAMII